MLCYITVTGIQKVKLAQLAKKYSATFKTQCPGENI